MIDKAQDCHEEDITRTRKMITIISNNDKNARDYIYYLKVRSSSIDHTQENKWLIIVTYLISILQVSNPTSAFRIIWELISMVFIFIQMIQIPLILAYSVDLDDGWTIFNNLMDIFFGIDLILNFKLAFYDKGDLVYSRKLIALHYLKCWFWIDFVAIFPYDLIAGEDNTQSTQILKFVRLLKFVKIVRLLRVLKLGRLFSKIEESFQIGIALQAIIQFLKIATLMLSIAHWTACIWNIIELYDDEITETWMKRYGVDNDDWTIKYISAIYLSVTTMTTIGYGDITPKTQIELLFSILAMLLASGIFGYSMSSLMQIIEGEDLSLLEQKQKNGKILRYIKQKGLPNQLSSRVKNYLEWLESSSQIAKHYEFRILDNLSMNLKTEIIFLLNGRILHSIQLLSRTFSLQLINKLVYVLKEQMLGPEEYVFKEKSYDNDKLYFIQNGSVAISLTEKELTIKTLHNSDYFGEIGFFGRQLRTATAKSIDFVKLMYLHRQDLWDSASNLDPDLQLLYYIRHCVEIENNFKPLRIRCFICDRPHHVAKNCSKVHFRVHRNRILEVYFESNNFRITPYERKLQKSKKTLLTLQILLTRAKLFEKKELKYYAYNYNSTTYQSIVEDNTKTSSNVETPKDYSDFYPEFNLTTLINKQDEFAEKVIQEMKEEKAKLLKQQWQSQRNMKQTMAPRNSRISFPSSSIPIEIEPQLYQGTILEQQSSISSPDNFNTHKAIKGKRLLDLMHQKETFKKSLSNSLASPVALFLDSKLNRQQSIKLKKIEFWPGRKIQRRQSLPNYKTSIPNEIQMMANPKMIKGIILNTILKFNNGL